MDTREWHTLTDCLIVKVVVSATLRSVARDSCSMFIVCLLCKISETVIEIYIYGKNTLILTIIFVIFVGMSSQKDFSFVIATITEIFYVMECDGRTLLLIKTRSTIKRKQRENRKTKKQREGVPAYLNLYNIVNWTTYYMSQPRLLKRELTSTSSLVLNFVCVCT